MFCEERQREIADIIRTEGNVTVASIAARYGISEESARRDLRLLEQRGVCRRTHGGAIAANQVAVRRPADRDFDNMPVYENYREISRVAAAKIKAGDTVYLTSGSFGHILLEFLPRGFEFTVVVNSVDLGKALRGFDNVDVYVAGGHMRKSGSIVDSLANDFISRLHFDLCFVTGAGLTSFGLTNGSDETATFQRTIIKNSRERILLMPSEKIGVDSFVRVCGADEFDEIITDWECPSDRIAELAECGVKPVVVRKPNEPR